MVLYVCFLPGMPDCGDINAKSPPYLHAKPLTSQLAHRGFCSSPIACQLRSEIRNSGHTFSAPLPTRQASRSHPLLARRRGFPGHDMKPCMRASEAKRAAEPPSARKVREAGAGRRRRSPGARGGGKSSPTWASRAEPRFHYIWLGDFSRLRVWVGFGRHPNQIELGPTAFVHLHVLNCHIYGLAEYLGPLDPGSISIAVAPTLSRYTVRHLSSPGLGLSRRPSAR